MGCVTTLLDEAEPPCGGDGGVRGCALGCCMSKGVVTGAAGGAGGGACSLGCCMSKGVVTGAAGGAGGGAGGGWGSCCHTLALVQEWPWHSPLLYLHLPQHLDIACPSGCLPTLKTPQCRQVGSMFR